MVTIVLFTYSDLKSRDTAGGVRIKERIQELQSQRPRVTVSRGVKDLLNLGVPNVCIRATLAILTTKLKTFRDLTRWKFTFCAHVKVQYSST